jgi:hypothetical protein
MQDDQGHGGRGGRGGRGGHGAGGAGGVGGEGGAPSGTGGEGGRGGSGDGGLRKIVLMLFPALVLFVALVVWNLWDSRVDNDALAAESQARAEASCDTALQGRASQLISSEVLILASTGGSEPTDPDQLESITRFRSLQDRIWLSELPATCDGIMRLDEFRRRIREQVSEATSGIAP